MTDKLILTVADGGRFRTMLDLGAVVRLAPGRVSGPDRVPESGRIGSPDTHPIPDADVTPELVDLIDSAHPGCEVIETKHNLQGLVSRRRCDLPAVWAIRTQCVCQVVAIDLLCADHYERLFNHLIYTCPSCGKRDDVISRVPSRL
jgi:hypothetical protein